MKATVERFTALCQRLGAKENHCSRRTVSSTFDELVAIYTGPDRYYHDLNHINGGLDSLDDSLALAQNPNALEMAWWFHDFVYNTGSKTNEYDSSLAADRMLYELGLSVAVRNVIVWLIMATKHDHIPDDQDQRLIIDIDLASLGGLPEVFDRNTADIRKEYSRVTDEDFKKGRSEFFKNFLNGRPSIYLNESFRNKYEAQARENLRRTMTVLEPKSA